MLKFKLISSKIKEKLLKLYSIYICMYIKIQDCNLHTIYFKTKILIQYFFTLSHHFDNPFT